MRPRRDQDRIEPDVANADVGISRQPSLGCGNDARPLAFGHRPGRLFQIRPRFDFHEDQQASAPGDDVDLAYGALETPRDDAEPLGDEQGRSPALGRDPGPERHLSTQIFQLRILAFRLGARARERAYRIVTHAL